MMRHCIMHSWASERTVFRAKSEGRWVNPLKIPAALLDGSK